MQNRAGKPEKGGWGLLKKGTTAFMSCVRWEREARALPSSWPHMWRVSKTLQSCCVPPQSYTLGPRGPYWAAASENITCHEPNLGQKCSLSIRYISLKYMRVVVIYLYFTSRYLKSQVAFRVLLRACGWTLYAQKRADITSIMVITC